MTEYRFQLIARELARLSMFAPIDWEALRKMADEQVPVIMAEQSAKEFAVECANRATTAEAVKFVSLYYGREWIREQKCFYIPSLQAVYADYTWFTDTASHLPMWNRIDQADYDGRYPVPLAAPTVLYCKRAFLCPRCLNFWQEYSISKLSDKQAEAAEKAVYTFFDQCEKTRTLRCTTDEINGIISKCYQKPFEYRVHEHDCDAWFDSVHFAHLKFRQARQLSAEWQAENPGKDFPPSVYYSVQHKTFDACLRHHGKWVVESFKRIEDAVLFVDAKLAEPPEAKKVYYPTKSEYQFFSLAKAASEIMKGKDDTITATTNIDTGPL